MMGRPAKINATVIDTVRKLAPTLNHVEPLAKLCDVTPRSFRAWLARGRKERDRLNAEGGNVLDTEVLYLSLLRAYENGLAEYELAALGVIKKAAFDGTWTAAAWLLERRYPERYSMNRGEIHALQRQLRELERALAGVQTAPSA